jgi:hypothetical protein
MDVFSWSYHDLKTYDTSIIEHSIPLKEGVKHFRHKLKHVNLLLLPMIEQKIKKLLDEQIIIPLIYLE